MGRVWSREAVDLATRAQFSVSSFFALILDNIPVSVHIGTMGKRMTSPGSRQTAKWIRQRIEDGGDRLWRFEDFPGVPASAVAQALSRLARQGQLQRLSKGVYYRARQTALGASLPNPVAIRSLAATRKAMFPAGIAAANLLGFTTQAAGRSELATSALSLPRKLVGGETVIHTRRPETWAALSAAEAALLDFLRRGGRTSELSPEETVRRTLALFRESRRFERLLKVAGFEPPRVRAMIGAIGEELGKDPGALKRLRASLNPLSRFDFGMLKALPCAGRWQAKELPPRSTRRSAVSSVWVRIRRGPRFRRAFKN